MKILYLHGIGGGKNSRTSQVIQSYFKDDEILAPEIPIDPINAYKFIWDYYRKYLPDIVIGTSLGAFYAMMLGGCYKVLINPAMIADEDIKNAIGLGYHEFNKERSNGETKYFIDDNFIEELKELKNHFYNECLDYEFRYETYAMFGTRDKLFSHIEDFKKIYGEKYIKFNGEHRLTNDDINNVLIPLIKKIKEINNVKINN